MPTIINPYGNQQTMGQDLFGLGGVADAFFGPKAATSAFTREKFKEAQRQNEFTPLVAQSYLNPNADPGQLAHDAAMAGMLPANVFGLRSGANIARMDPNAIVTSQGQNAITQNMLTIPGTSFTSTPTYGAASLQKGYDTEIAKTERLITAQRLKDESELVSVYDPTSPTGTRTMTRAELQAGNRASPGLNTLTPSVDQLRASQATKHLFPAPGSPQLPMTPETRHFLQADPQKPEWFNWVAPPLTPGGAPQRGTSTDGRTDDRTKQPLPDQYQLYTPGSQGAGATASAFEPGNTEKKDYREAIRHADQTLQLGGKIIELVNRNPTAIGAVGNLRLMGQEGADLVNSLNVFFGSGKPGDYDQSVIQARFQLRQKYGDGVAKLIPELFDPDLNSVRTMNGMLLYKAAAALGQSGRDASDKDIMFVKGLTGDPSAWFQGPNTYKDKINTLMTIIQQQKNDDAGRLRAQSVIPPGGTGAPAATAAPGSGTTSTGVPWTVGP